MDATGFIVWLLQSLALHPHVVNDELDEDTCERMRRREEHLSHQMTRLLQELVLSGDKPNGHEQNGHKPSGHKPSGVAWRAQLFAALQQWQFWAIAGVLILLFMLCWWVRQRRSSSSSSISSSSSSSNSSESSCYSSEQEEEDSDEEDPNLRDLAKIYARRIQWPMETLAKGSAVVKELVGDLLYVCQDHLSRGFMPVLQPAIGVGSAFEGWSPWEEEALYRMLVPLKPPHGHTFHLELGTTEEKPTKDSCIRVQLECTCAQKQQACKMMLCFIHDPEEELRSQDPSLLSTLCTGSYLDVQKTVCWFQDLVDSAWAAVPQSHHYKMSVLPSSRSCKLQLTSASTGTLLTVEMLFGVQQGDSDIFLTSQASETICTPSTTWPESYAVAEAKFFSHMARQAPPRSFHLQCLHVCTRLVLGTCLSTYIMKTLFMHLLSTMPLSCWRRRDFLPRLEDILYCLHCCLKKKYLPHFFFGNLNMPREIRLPPGFQTAEPPNLFQSLAQKPDDHAEALCSFEELQSRLIRLLFCGQ